MITVSRVWDRGAKRWITFRDAETYAGVVQPGRLFPLNSLMLHGIIYARHAQHLGDDPEHVFPHEVHAYFGTGTQLQEMYITPSLLSAADWDVLAKAATGRVTMPAYCRIPIGWEAILENWKCMAGPLGHPRKGFLHCGTLAIRRKVSRSIRRRCLSWYPRRRTDSMLTWNEEKNANPVELESGKPHTFALIPFQVLTLEAVPIPWRPGGLQVQNISS